MSQNDAVSIRLALIEGHWALGEYEEALCAAERAREGAASDPRLRSCLQALRERSEVAGVGPGVVARLAEFVRLVGAHADASPAVGPGPALATPTLAELLAQQGHSGQALRVAEDAVRKNPDDARARAIANRLRAPSSATARRRVVLERWLGYFRRRRQGECP